MFNFIQVTLSLLLVLGLIFVAYKLLQRLQKQQPLNRSSLQIRASVMVGQREKVILLEADGQPMLIGVGPGQVRFLTHLANSSSTVRLPENGEQASTTTTDVSTSWLKQQLDKTHGL
jgi:flagellar protein FliO/FliZ